MIEQNAITLDAALTRSEAFSLLTGSDRGFARAIISAALREQGRIDAVLETLIDRPLSETTPAARALLRAGAAQIFRLETADHAAVSETVQAARLWSPARKAGGFLNAVLRKATTEKARSAFDATPLVAIWPDWLRRRIVSTYGGDVADALASLQIDPPALDLQVQRNGSELQEALSATFLPPNGLRVAADHPVPSLPGYEAGDWWVQDRASALPVEWLDPKPGDRVWDMCAAPGGKTLQLAARGCQVTATDRGQGRLRLLRSNAKRTGLSFAVVGDATQLEWDQPFDAVLLDAPCSALGTLRRHPEGAWNKTPADITRFADRQSRLLASAIGATRPGGLILYSVCTLTPEEGVDQIRRALDEHPVSLAVRDPKTHPDLSGNGVSNEGVLTLPGAFISGPSDVFFVACLQKDKISS